MGSDWRVFSDLFSSDLLRCLRRDLTIYIFLKKIIKKIYYPFFSLLSWADSGNEAQLIDCLLNFLYLFQFQVHPVVFTPNWKTWDGIVHKYYVSNVFMIRKSDYLLMYLSYRSSWHCNINNSRYIVLSMYVAWTHG